VIFQRISAQLKSQGVCLCSN